MTRTKFKSKTEIKRTSKPGPKGYFEPSMIEEVHKLAAFGMTNQEIADFYEISISSLETYIRKYPEFNKSLQKGRVEDSLKVVASLHKQALGYEVMEHETHETLDKFGNIITLHKHTKKHIQPNVTAAIYLLKTRHGDKWMDIIKTESTTNYNIHSTIDFSGMSDEDLLALEKLGMKLTTQKTGMKQLVENVRSN